MRLSRGEQVVSVLAWVAVGALIVVAALIAEIFGLAGRSGLGLATALICIRAELSAIGLVGFVWQTWLR